MEITLTPELKQFVQAQVQSGRYRSVDHVIHVALRRLRRREKQLARLRRMLQQGDDDFEAGRHASKEVVFARLRAKRASQIETLRRALDPAIAEYERGERIPGPLAVEQARAEFRRLTGRESRPRDEVG